MPYKFALPEERAGATTSASSAAASAFYDDDQSVTYTTQGNAAIQRDLTRHALELLHYGGASSTVATSTAADATTISRDASECKPWLLLDLGAGSGLSTLAANEWLHEHQLLGFTMAFDISASMLSLTASNADAATAAAADATQSRNANLADAASALSMQRTGFYRGNAAQRFPLRRGVFHAAIGISMLQWLTRDGLDTCFASLYAQLSAGSIHHNHTSEQQRCAVFQIYPQSLEAVERMEQSARAVGFARAEVFVSFPHVTTAKKWFLRVDVAVDSRHISSASYANPSLCLFGRRFDRTCAWHLLEPAPANASTATATATTALRERLGREHVRTAWRIWRKFRRARACANDATPTHAKAKRSLELYASDEMIGQALLTMFVPPSDSAMDASSSSSSSSSTGDTTMEQHEDERATAITYATMLARMDDVVDVLHTAYTAAAALDGRLPARA